MEFIFFAGGCLGGLVAMQFIGSPIILYIIIGVPIVMISAGIGFFFVQ